MIRKILLVACCLAIIGFTLQNGSIIFMVICGGTIISILYICYVPKNTVMYGPRNIPKSIKDHILKKQNGMCGYPGCRERNYLHLHHKLAVAQGGSGHHSNLVYLCPNHHSMAHDSEPRTVNYKKVIYNVKA